MELPTIISFPNPPDRAEEGSDFGTALAAWISDLNTSVTSINTYMDAVELEGLTLSAGMPAHFSRSAPLAAKTVATAADRYTLIPWPLYGVNVGGTGFYGSGAPMSLSDPTVWDSTATDYTVAANRAGKDFFLYACNDGSAAPKLLLSANATAPTGYTASTSRQLGGFHCLCADVGVIGGHPLSGYLAGDILPMSVWDQLHRPVCSPLGMVYAPGIGKWIDIYLPSLSGGDLTSVYNGQIADGMSGTAFDWYMFAEFFGRIGKRMLTQSEFIVAAGGCHGGSSVVGGTDPTITGNHIDSSGIRIVSNIGCEDCCGVMWQWVNDTAGMYDISASFVNQGTSGSSLSGYGLYVPYRGIVGGDYNSGSNCGALCSEWDITGTTLGASITSRGISDAL